jgi:hypothetical protein
MNNIMTIRVSRFNIRYVVRCQASRFPSPPYQMNLIQVVWILMDNDEPALRGARTCPGQRSNFPVNDTKPYR